MVGFVTESVSAQTRDGASEAVNTNIQPGRVAEEHQQPGGEAEGLTCSMQCIIMR